MKKKRRILFVDDEVSLRLTLPAVLERHGFQVDAAATVKDALAAMHRHHFDVLISDLNIGEPGDGFTVVSAMRRTQPHAVTLIITGYPAFETALQAIRSQVDDYVVKPADVAQLVDRIEDKLRQRNPRHMVQPKPVVAILEENSHKIVTDWLAAVVKVPEIASIKLTPEQRSDHLPGILQAIMHLLHSGRDGSPALSAQAAQHGMTRRQQGYTIPMILQETHLLHGIICQTLQQNLLAIEVSSLISDLIKVTSVLHDQLRESISAYLSRDVTRPGRTARKSRNSKKAA
ncbi:MAG TPA: response regulator [Terriglobales bacterium]|jgi:DNA-binding response OmpR family regulator|nr:response regulator [Terriglobales bacterium]